MGTEPATFEVVNFIAGVDVPGTSGEHLDVMNPATGDVIGRLALSTAHDVDEAVGAAKAAFAEWAAQTPGQRSHVLKQLGDIVEAHLDELAELEVLDAGKPWNASREVELPGILDALRHFGASARMSTGQAAGEFQAGNTTFVRREPYGVVAGITPWNFPLWQAVWKIAPALAAGNTVVMKPAENTPLSTTRFAQLASGVLPPGVLNVVHGLGPVVGDALVRHPDVALVSFTGSVAAGRNIAQAAASAPKPVILELGGNSPAIIFSDADLDRASEILTNGILYNAGQECMSSTRLLVQESIRDDFLNKLIEVIRAKAVMGDVNDPKTTLGPVISEVQRDRIEGFISRRSEGSTMLLGGPRPDQPGFWVVPTIIADVNQHDEIVQEEIFGPVATVQTFTDEADAVAKANDVRFGLAGSVWTTNIGRALRVVNALDFGNVWVNNHMVVGPEMPIGGFGESGYGKEGGIAGIEAFTRLKQVVVSLS